MTPGGGGPFNHEFAKFRFHFGVGNNIRPGQKMDTPGSVAVLVVPVDCCKAMLKLRGR